MANKANLTAAKMLGAAGGRARAAKLSAAELSRIGRMAAKAKYAKRRRKSSRKASTSPSSN